MKMEVIDIFPKVSQESQVGPFLESMKTALTFASLEPSPQYIENLTKEELQQKLKSLHFLQKLAIILYFLEADQVEDIKINTPATRIENAEILKKLGLEQCGSMWQSVNPPSLETVISLVTQKANILSRLRPQTMHRVPPAAHVAAPPRLCNVSTSTDSRQPPATLPKPVILRHVQIDQKQLDDKHINQKKNLYRTTVSPGDWLCTGCTCINSNNSANCNACLIHRPKDDVFGNDCDFKIDSKIGKKTESKLDSGYSTSQSSKLTELTANEKWPCEKCSFNNEKENLSCGVCRHPQFNLFKEPNDRNNTLKAPQKTTKDVTKKMDEKKKCKKCNMFVILVTEKYCEDCTWPCLLPKCKNLNSTKKDFCKKCRLKKNETVEFGKNKVLLIKSTMGQTAKAWFCVTCNSLCSLQKTICDKCNMPRK